LSNSVAELDSSVAEFALCFFGFSFVNFQWPNGAIRWLNLGPELFQFYERYFYYKYRLCIRVTLEIEGSGNKGLKGNIKTRVCIGFAGWK